MDISRRDLAHAATCWICAAGAVSALAPGVALAADGPAVNGTPGLSRKLIAQMDGPMPGYVTITAEVTIEPNATVGRHTHPGIESGYVVEGGIDLPIEGQPTRALKPGDGFQVPVGTPHAGAPNGPARTKIVSTYIVEKGRPLATPV